MCVTVRIVHTDTGATRCGFVRADPELGSEVPRGATVVMVSGTQPCGSLVRAHVS
jgi:hypothetical protein